MLGFSGRAQRETRALRVVVKHLHGVEGVVVEILANEKCFFKHVMSNSNHMAADGLGMIDVQQLARTCPDQFVLGKSSKRFDGSGRGSIETDRSGERPGRSARRLRRVPDSRAIPCHSPLDREGRNPARISALRFERRSDEFHLLAWGTGQRPLIEDLSGTVSNFGFRVTIHLCRIRFQPN